MIIIRCREIPSKKFMYIASPNWEEFNRRLPPVYTRGIGVYANLYFQSGLRSENPMEGVYDKFDVVDQEAVRAVIMEEAPKKMRFVDEGIAVATEKGETYAIASGLSK